MLNKNSLDILGHNNLEVVREWVPTCAFSFPQVGMKHKLSQQTNHNTVFKTVNCIHSSRILAEMLWESEKESLANAIVNQT